MLFSAFPDPQGLYDPDNESDSCGVAVVADIQGRRSHAIVTDGLTALEHLDHRGAAGAETNSGDGAGILIQLPVEMLREVVDFELPEPALDGTNAFAAGICFMPQDSQARARAGEAVETIADDEGLEILGWRRLPVEPDRADIGKTALSCMPHMEQLFVTSTRGIGGIELDRCVYPLRKRPEREGVYFPSLSSRTIVYKGMLTTTQLPQYFSDLRDERCQSAIAIVHSRFSTNTFPSWPLAHPFRFVAHNGEINTVRGNRNRMHAREAKLASARIPGDLSRLSPICTPEESDSASFDEVLELLHLGGRTLPHAVLMMIPEAWENNTTMAPEERSFWQFHASLMEPWDGPACVTFTDGTLVGAVLDRNGLRPGRWWRTIDDRVILASESGVLDVPSAQIVVKRRLQPGKMFLVDTAAGEVSQQARRCMDCGIPFCHSGSAGCPLGNLIPEWNDLVRRGRWDAASDRLHATNNFPEFTGRLCPAPCEAACVLSISEEQTGGSVTIKRIEQTIADQAWMDGIVEPQPAAIATGKRVAVVGSGPAGLAAAQQLTRAGHDVTVYERDDRIGGLMRYGIPEYKLEKATLDQRLAQMRAEGTRFVTECELGVDLPVEKLRAQYDAVVLAVGALSARDNDVAGRDLKGVHLAMEHLVPANKECEGDGPSPISAEGKHVVIIGGGDTGADCLGTAHRQGAVSVTQLDYNPEPPEVRDDSRSPWPTWPIVLRTRLSPAHAEGGDRRYEVAVQRFLGDDRGHLRAMGIAEVKVERDVNGRRIITPVGEPMEIPCDLALLAIGFDGVEHMPLLDALGLTLNRRGALSCGSDWQTDAPGVFVCGDAHRGASLIVWAIAEGRSAAHAVDAYLMGESDLPAPVVPGALPLAVV